MTVKLSDMINKAEALGACAPAIKKLRQCQNWEDVLSHPDSGKWADWARYAGLLPETLQPAGEAFDEATDNAEKAYDKAVYNARKAYDKAIYNAEKVRDSGRNNAIRQFAEAVYTALKKD